MQIATKQIVTDLAIIEGFKSKCNNVGSFGFKGVTIDVFNCREHSHEYLINMKGLGHTLYMVYLFDPNNKELVSIESLIAECFDDFKDFIIYEREEHHKTLH